LHGGGFDVQHLAAKLKGARVGGDGLIHARHYNW
jgi:hypothetical protein